MAVILWMFVGVFVLKTFFQVANKKLNFIEAVIRITAVVFVAIGLSKHESGTTELLEKIIPGNFFLVTGSILSILLTIKWIFSSSKNKIIQPVDQINVSKPDEKNIQDLCLKVLQEEGYKGIVDDKGNIDFKHEGSIAKIVIASDYVGICYPYAYEFGNEKNKRKMLEVMNTINNTYDIAKLAFYDDSDCRYIMASSFIYLPNLSNLRLFFSDYFAVIRSFIDDFNRKMVE
jgi:hypothetical protein